MSTIEKAPSRPAFPIISAKNAWILTGILLAAFAVGSFYDFQISQALVNPSNPLGIFGAAYGAYPLGIVFFTGGLMLIMFRNRDRAGIRITQVVLGALLALIGAAALVALPIRYIDSATALVVTINVVIVGVIGWVTFKSLQDVNRDLAVRVATIIVLVAVAELIIVNIVKIGWERPRMRMLMENPDAAFASWWNPGNPDRAALMESGVVAEEFKSFPSGHTANGALAIVFTAYTVLKKGWAKLSSWLFWIGALWGAYVGISRVIVGAHFVTDIVAGFAVTFICVLIAYRVGFPARLREIQELQEQTA